METLQSETIEVPKDPTWETDNLANVECFTLDKGHAVVLMKDGSLAKFPHSMLEESIYFKLWLNHQQLIKRSRDFPAEYNRINARAAQSARRLPEIRPIHRLANIIQCGPSLPVTSDQPSATCHAVASPIMEVGAASLGFILGVLLFRGCIQRFLPKEEETRYP